MEFYTLFSDLISTGFDFLFRFDRAMIIIIIYQEKREI